MNNTLINKQRLEKLLANVDALNEHCPEKESLPDGKQASKEVLYSQRMYKQLMAFIDSPSEELIIACYCQHIQRWVIARKDYPMNRSGYKRWRSDLGRFHAKTTAEQMSLLDYNDKSMERVEYLLQKKGLKRDEETQALEDVICLVFLEYYLEDFAAKHTEEKLISIIQKTWNKMSENGHTQALTLPFKPHLLALIQKALS